jgi:hypothetical protein
MLLQRKKTEMEDLFSTAIPQQQRGGSRFVFRQGNPLNAGDLKLVAAGAAAAGNTLVVCLQACHLLCI